MYYWFPKGQTTTIGHFDVFNFATKVETLFCLLWSNIYIYIFIVIWNRNERKNYIIIKKKKNFNEKEK